MQHREQIFVATPVYGEKERERQNDRERKPNTDKTFMDTTRVLQNKVKFGKVHQIVL